MACGHQGSERSALGYERLTGQLLDRLTPCPHPRGETSSSFYRSDLLRSIGLIPVARFPRRYSENDKPQGGAHCENQPHRRGHHEPIRREWAVDAHHSQNTPHGAEKSNHARLSMAIPWHGILCPQYRSTQNVSISEFRGISIFCRFLPGLLIGAGGSVCTSPLHNESRRSKRFYILQH